MKALGVGLGAVRFHDIDVVRRGLDAPFLVLHGAAAERPAPQLPCGWHLSLTHTDRVALAVVVADATGDGGRTDRSRVVAPPASRKFVACSPS